MPPSLSQTTVPWLLSGGMYLAALMWGMLWGSFANVVIHRVPLGQSVVHPRSRCPSCEAPIAAYDNVPVLSYLVLRGKCRRCGAAVSARYPIVELLCGALSAATYLRFVHLPLVLGEDPELLAWLLWFAFGLAMLIVTYIDLDYWIIPDVVVVPGAIVGALLSIVAPSVLGTGAPEALGAAVGGYGLFAGIRWVYKRFRGIEALGLGDAKLLLMVGAWTGPYGLSWTIGAGALQGILVSVPILLFGGRVANRALQDVHGDDPELGEDDPDHVSGQRVPFGPFLALAALEFVLLEPVLLGWYERFVLLGG